MTPSICIVGGCGHVGLPLGIAFARAGATVTLLDTSEERSQQVAAGQMPFMEQGGEAALGEALASGRLRVTREAAEIAGHEVIIVTIGTPVDAFLDPKVSIFDEAMEGVLEPMRNGQLLVLRSTVFPGVTDRLARRLARRRLEVDVAHCPERIAQGYALEELSSLPQIIGGTTPCASARACQLFELLGTRNLELPAIEAELAKLFSNAYRYINFAISNQFYLISEKFGADFHRVHRAATTDYPRLRGFAKAGFTGGPCLLKDTMQLGAFNHNAFAIGQAAMMVNEGMPSALIELVKKKHDLSQMTAAILGMAFKGDSDDYRDSLSYKLRKLLALECRRVLCTDPYIEDSSFVPLETALAEADIVFLGACHDEYRNLSVGKPLIDVFDFIRREAEA